MRVPLKALKKALKKVLNKQLSPYSAQKSTLKACSKRYSRSRVLKKVSHKSCDPCKKNEWPRKTKGNLTTDDPGMDKFWQRLDTQDVSNPLPTGLKVLMSSLSTSTSTSNLFQVFVHQNYVSHLYLTLAH